MLRGEMKDMTVAWSTEKGSALPTLFQLVRLKGDLTPPRHQAADVQTPVGVQVIHHPIIALHTWSALLRLFEMPHKIRRLAGGPHGPGQLACGHRQRVDEDARAVADVLRFASLAPAGLGRFGGGFAFQDLPTGFFIAAHHQTTVLVGLKRLGVQLANGVGFGIKVLIVALQPVRTLMGLQIEVLQDTPEARAADGIRVEGLKPGGDELIQGPAGDGALLRLGSRAGNRDDLDTRG